MTSGSTEDYELPGCSLEPSESLRYFFDKYMVSVDRGKPNTRAAHQLKLMIDSVQIAYELKRVKETYALTHNINDNPKMVFKIPIGNMSEEESKSLIQKIKDMFK